MNKSRFRIDKTNYISIEIAKIVKIKCKNMIHIL